MIMSDLPSISDGADASLRKTVSLLNKLNAKTSVPATISLSGLAELNGVSRGPIENRSGFVPGGLAVRVFRKNPKRTYLFFQNKSGYQMYVGIGRPPKIPNVDCILVPGGNAGVKFCGSFIPTEDIYVLIDSSSSVNSNFIALQAPPDPDPIIVGSGGSLTGSLTGSLYPYDIGFGEDYFGGGELGTTSLLVGWYAFTATGPNFDPATGNPVVENQGGSTYLGVEGQRRVTIWVDESGFVTSNQGGILYAEHFEQNVDRGDSPFSRELTNLGVPIPGPDGTTEPIRCFGFDPAPGNPKYLRFRNPWKGRELTSTGLEAFFVLRLGAFPEWTQMATPIGGLGFSGGEYYENVGGGVRISSSLGINTRVWNLPLASVSELQQWHIMNIRTGKNGDWACSVYGSSIEGGQKTASYSGRTFFPATYIPYVEVSGITHVNPGGPELNFNGKYFRDGSLTDLQNGRASYRRITEWNPSLPWPVGFENDYAILQRGPESNGAWVLSYRKTPTQIYPRVNVASSSYSTDHSNVNPIGVPLLGIGTLQPQNVLSGTILMDSVQIRSYSTPYKQGSLDPDSQQVFLGRTLAYDDLGFRGSMAEVMLYDGVLSSSQRSAVLSYLEEKFSEVL